MVKIRIEIIDDPKPIEPDMNFNYVNYQIVTDILIEHKKIKKNQIEFIKFLNNLNAWETIKPSTPNIKITNENTLKLMVQISIPDQTIESLKNKAESMISFIDEEYSEFEELSLSNNGSTSMVSSFFSSKQLSSKNLLESFHSETNIINQQDDTRTDIIVLTANPLVYRYEEGKYQELRIINEFHSITDSIKEVISSNNLAITSEFKTLTKINFKNAISKKPKILHLICKSIYEKDYYQMDSYYPVLLFENGNCEMVKINQEDLSTIFESYKDNIKKISLFISTPLCEDVFDMFETLSEYKFKNILVQNTTLADVSYMAQFNQELYYYLLDKVSLETAFDSAKIQNISDSQFCCCYHKHEENCPLISNLSNELFRTNKDLFFKEKKKGNNKEPLKLLPHVYHLRYGCYCEDYYNKNDFTYHKDEDCVNQNSTFFHQKKPSGFKYSLCCCINKKKNKKHNIDDIFKLRFHEGDKSIFENYAKDEYKRSIILHKNYLPHYERLYFKVGSNIIFYEAFKFISEDNNIINFYGNQNSLEIDDIINILIEFIKERYDYFSTDINLIKYIILDRLSDKDIKLIKSKLPPVIQERNIDLNRQGQHSEKELGKRKKSFQSLSLLNKNSLSSNTINESFIKYPVFIINVLKSPEWKKTLKKIANLSDISAIIFSQNEIKDKEISNKVTHIAVNNLDNYDKYIKNQIYKININKIDDFEDLLREKVIYLESKEIKEIQKLINEKSKESEMYHLILYLFNCVNSGLLLFEFDRLFSEEEFNEAKSVRDLYIEKKIIVIEIGILNNGIIKKDRKKYNKYIKNKNSSNIIFDMINVKSYEIGMDHIKIPDNIKYDVLQRLIIFYAKNFRYIIEKIIQNGIHDKSKEKENKFVPYLFYFSAIQSLGIWLPFNGINKFKIKNEPADVYGLKGFLLHLSRNFHDIFNKEVLDFCYNNSDFWDNIKEYLEDISITLVSLYNIFNDRQIEETITKFKSIFNNNYGFSEESKLRFDLFVIMTNDYNINNKNVIIQELKYIEGGFRKLKNKEGELEALFAKGIMNKENDNFTSLNNIYEGQMKKILNKLKEDNVKKNFADIFDNKTKLKLYEYKILC